MKSDALFNGSAPVADDVTGTDGRDFAFFAFEPLRVKRVPVFRAIGASAGLVYITIYIAPPARASGPIFAHAAPGGVANSTHSASKEPIPFGLRRFSYKR